MPIYIYIYICIYIYIYIYICICDILCIYGLENGPQQYQRSC